MGRFFSSVQIKSNGSREQFLKAFCDLMIKRGLATCSEDEASVSYILAFSESSKWVTLTCEAYRDDTNRVKTDARQTAAEMKTSSFGMEVVDSDFALLQLYKNSSAADTVIVGDGSGYGFVGCPKDACEEVIQRADYISYLKGGCGAVRDVIMYLLKIRGEWKNAVSEVYGIGI